MKLQAKFIILAVSVCTIPVAIAGYFAARIGQSAIRDSIEAQEQAVANQAADYVAGELGQIEELLRVQSRVLDLTHRGTEAPSEQRLLKFLQFLYHQKEVFSIVGVYSMNGIALAPPAFQERPRANAALGKHDAMTTDDAATLPKRAPMLEVGNERISTSEVFLAGPEGNPQMIMAMPFETLPD